MSEVEQSQEASFDNLSKEQCQKIANQWNKKEGYEKGDKAYIDPNQDQEQLAKELEKKDRISDGLIDVEKEQSVVEVPLSKIEKNAKNYRHRSDLYDKNLQEQIDEDDGLINPVTLKEVEKDGETMYTPLSGNRRIFNYKAVIDHRGEDPSDVTVPATLVKTTGDKVDKAIDEIITLYRANEERLDLSVVNKMQVMQDLDDEGLTRSSIAEKLDVSRAYVSQIMKLRHLPQRILDLVHFEQTSEHQKTKSKRQLEKMNIPFTEDSDGEVEILGILVNSAKEMASLYPPESNDDFDKEKEKINDFLTDRSLEFVYKGETHDGGVITAAQLLSQNKFKKVLESLEEQYFGTGDDDSENEGDGDGSSTSNEQSANEDSSEDGTDAGSDDTNEQDGASDEGDDSSSEDDGNDVQESKVEALIDFEPAEKALDIEEGQVELSDDWERRLAEELTMGNNEVAAAVAILEKERVLVETDED